SCVFQPAASGEQADLSSASRRHRPSITDPAQRRFRQIHFQPLRQRPVPQISLNIAPIRPASGAGLHTSAVGQCSFSRAFFRCLLRCNATTNEINMPVSTTPIAPPPLFFLRREVGGGG